MTRNRSQIGKKNRKDGRNFEGWLIKRLAAFFNLEHFNNKNFFTSNIGSTGVFSKILDGQKQDIWFKDDVFKDLAFQCKKTLTHGKDKKNIDIQPLLDMNQDKIRILVTKVTMRPNKNEKEIGKFVTMSYEDFEKYFLNLWKESNFTESTKE